MMMYDCIYYITNILYDIVLYYTIIYYNILKVKARLRAEPPYAGVPEVAIGGLKGFGLNQTRNPFGFGLKGFKGEPPYAGVQDDTIIMRMHNL